MEKLFLLKVLEKAGAFLQHCYAIFLVLISWVIFAFEDLKQIGTYLASMFAQNQIPLINSQAIYYAKNYGLPIIIGIILSMPILWKLLEKIESKKGKLSSIAVSILYVGVLLLCTASLVSDSYNPFLYFRF